MKQGVRNFAENSFDNAALRQALTSFGLSEFLTPQHISKTTWQVREEYILKGYADMSELSKTLKLNELLHQAGVPVVEYLRTPQGDRHVQVENMGFTLAYKITGEHPIPLQGNYQHHLKIVGRETAKLHRALLPLQYLVEARDIDTAAALQGWIAQEIAKAELYIPHKIWDYAVSFGELYHRLPRQLIHRDLHLQNLVFLGDELAGFLDFDISEINVRLFDLCYFGLSLLFGDYQNPMVFTRWQEAFPLFLASYHDVSPLLPDELQAIPPLFVCIELLFAAFYARQGHRDSATGCVDMAVWLYERRELFQFKF